MLLQFLKPPVQARRPLDGFIAKKDAARISALRRLLSGAIPYNRLSFQTVRAAHCLARCGLNKQQAEGFVIGVLIFGLLNGIEFLAAEMQINIERIADDIRR